MKFDEGITIDMVGEQIDSFLEALRYEREEAVRDHDKDPSDVTAGNMATFFKLAEEMLLNRLSTISEEAEGRKRAASLREPAA